MSFLMYFIFRKFFVKQEFSEKQIVVRKGMFLRRTAVMPLKSVVKISVKRNAVMRIFRAKRVTVYSLSGKIFFYLKNEEALPFLPKTAPAALKPRFSELIFGAFIDTRALGAIALFAAVLHKIGKIFGGDYFNEIISAFFAAAEDVAEALSVLHIAVPRIAAAGAVFALSAWAFAYLVKLARLSRFRVGRRGELLTVKSGLITLYENTLVLNSAAAISCETLSALAAKRAPVYLRGVMIYPAASREKLPRLLRVLCKLKPENIRKTTSPKSAFFGHCSAPLGWAAGFFAALLLTYLFEELRSAMLLKTFLYSGSFVSLYAAVICLAYMKRSGAAFGERAAIISARRSMRLYTAVFPRETITEETISRNIFQRRSRLCDLKIAISERKKFKARLLPERELHHTQ